MVTLTVSHDELEAGSSMFSGITKGWPAVLSSLKSQCYEMSSWSVLIQGSLKVLIKIGSTDTPASADIL